MYLALPAQELDSVPLEVHLRLKMAGFEVIPFKPGGPPVEAQGSGFVLTPQGHILTCAHVIRDQTNATVWIQGTRHLGSVTAIDTNLDAAILVVAEPHAPFRPLPFARESARMGQEAYTIGFPLASVLGIAPRLNKGLVSADVGLQDDPHYLQISVEVQPGNSGSPLLSQRGEVIGMIAATLNPWSVLANSGAGLPQNVNFAIKAGPLKDFLTASSVHLPIPEELTPNPGIETARDSVALVRAGVAEERDLKQPALWCRFFYNARRDLPRHLSYFTIEFRDSRTGALVFQAVCRENAVPMPKDAVLDSVFTEVSSKFFPTHPNPFK